MKKLHKFLVLLLTVCMAVSMLAACGEKEPKEDNKSTQGNQSSSNEGDNENASEWSWPLAEKKDLGVWLAWSNNYTTDPNELKAIKQIEANTNVHITWTTVAGQEASEKFGLMMASGDYPDIVCGLGSYYTGGLVKAHMDGVIEDMTDLIPKYMPTYQALRTSNEKLQRDTQTDDGRLLGAFILASKNGEVMGERAWDGMCLRQDWLNDLNLSVPTTIDDWHNVLKAFKDNYSTCEAPLMIGAQNGYDICHSFLSAYGVLGEFYQENNVVKFGPLEDGYKQWVQLFHDWYAEGLIDPNFITNDAAMMGSADYMGTGKAGASANIWGCTADIWKSYTDDEDFWLVAAPAPVLNEGDPPQIGYNMSEPVKGSDTVLSNNCKDTELACRWLDYWYTTECMFLDSLGIENESYVANGDGTYSIGDAIHAQIDSGEFPSISEAIYAQYTLGTSDFGLYNWDMFTPMYEGNPATAAYDVWDVNKTDLMLPSFMTMTEEESISYNSLYTAIKTLVQENTIKFITGSRSIDEYDSFIADLKNYGIEECIGYKQAALDRYNAR